MNTNNQEKHPTTCSCYNCTKERSQEKNCENCGHGICSAGNHCHNEECPNFGAHTKACWDTLKLSSDCKKCEEEKTCCKDCGRANSHGVEHKCDGKGIEKLEQLKREYMECSECGFKGTRQSHMTREHMMYPSKCGVGCSIAHTKHTCQNRHVMVGVGSDVCPECEAPWIKSDNTNNQEKKCCLKCESHSMIDVMVKGPTHVYMCSKKDCECHVSHDSKKCESCLAGFSKEDIQGNCTCSPSSEKCELCPVCCKENRVKNFNICEKCRENGVTFIPDISPSVEECPKYLFDLTDKEKDWLNMLVEKAFAAPFDKMAVRHCMFRLYEKSKRDISQARTAAYETSMGASKWQNHGAKYGYAEYFDKRLADAVEKARTAALEQAAEVCCVSCKKVIQSLHGDNNPQESQ